MAVGVLNTSFPRLTYHDIALEKVRLAVPGSLMCRADISPDSTTAKKPLLITADEVKDIPFLIPYADTGFYRCAGYLMKQAGLYPAKTMTYGNMNTAYQLCARGVGDDFDLIPEIHRSMNFAQAAAFAKSVEKYNLLFLEDPIPPDNNNAMAALAQSISIPIATGERFININEFEDLLAENGARYIGPDVCALGGITPSKKAAAIADAHYVDIMPHNPLGPVSTAACSWMRRCRMCAYRNFPAFTLIWSQTFSPTRRTKNAHRRYSRRKHF